MGTDIFSMALLFFTGSEGALHLYLYCIAFIGECYPIKTGLKMGTPDGLGTHAQLMLRVSVGLLSAVVAPSSP